VTDDCTRDPVRFISSDRTWPPRRTKALTSANDLASRWRQWPGADDAVTSHDHRAWLRSLRAIQTGEHLRSLLTNEIIRRSVPLPPPQAASQALVPLAPPRMRLVRLHRWCTSRANGRPPHPAATDLLARRERRAVLPPRPPRLPRLSPARPALLARNVLGGVAAMTAFNSPRTARNSRSTN
jgi:hypothetical protein